MVKSTCILFKNPLAKGFKLIILFVLFSCLAYGQGTSIFTTSGSWTAPAGVTSIQVEAYGAGGGGGYGGSSNKNGGGGGGGGGYTRNTAVAVTPGTTYTITVGIGGSGGNASNGGNGTASSATFNVVTVTGNFGFGGNSYTNGGNGGAGGAAGTFAGGNGGTGNATGSGGGGGAAGTTSIGGNGNIPNGGTAGTGGTIAGAGGAGNTSNTVNGVAGDNYGGGGGGGTKDKVGGNGANGYVIITAPCPAVETANAGADQTFTCATVATVTGNTPVNATGEWTLISGSGTILTSTNPTTDITDLGIGTNVFRWTLTASGCFTTFDDVSIINNQGPGCWNYCTSNASNTTYSYISNVSFNTINNSSTGCANYTDFTNISTIVSMSSSYTLTITKINNCSGTTAYTGRFAAWIDWNNDGDFADAGEQVLSDAAASNGPVSVSVTVPVGAYIGTTRMRCIFREGSTAPPYCGAYSSWGETEDYSITINTLTACSGTPNAGTTVINPSNGCGDLITLTSSGSSLNSGLIYQWQKSINGGATWSSFGSPMSMTPTSITDAPSVTSRYRLSVVCANSGITSNSNQVTYTLNTSALTTRTWIGAGAGGTGTDFNTATNWSPNAVPSSCDSVVIKLTGAATITMSANSTVGALFYQVEAAVTGVLNIQSNVLIVNRSSTFNATNGNCNVNLATGGGIRSRGHCYFHTSAAGGVTYLYAATANPGYLQCDADLIVGTKGRTAAGVEPKLVFDAPVAQTWMVNNTGTYFLGEHVIFGLKNSPVITLGGTGSYTDKSVYDGNVQINNTTLVKAMNIPIDKFSGTGTFSMTSGSKLELNFANDMPAPYTYALNANSTVEYLGDNNQSVNGITYGHLISGGDAIKIAVGNIVIAGNFLIRDLSTFQAANSTILRTHNMRGNFTNNGTFTTNASFPSTFIMDGIIDQYIQGTVSPTFYNLTVNKPSSSGFLNINTQVGTATAGVMAFTAGPLNLNARTLTINNAAAAAVTRSAGCAISENSANASKIQWNMISTTGAHVFPFGTIEETYIPFTFNLTAGTIGNVTVSTYPTALNNTPYPSTPQAVTNVNNAIGADNSINIVDRFWQIDKTGASGTATLTFMATAAEVSSILTLQAQRWNSSSWDAPAAGQTSLATGATVSGVTTFSPWILSGSGGPLPIELVSFNADYNGKYVDLTWSTASEINNESFIVERTTNGTDFEFVNKVKGAGTSYGVLNYKTTDFKPYSSLAYYRLKQTDFDGKIEYSELVAVTIKNNNETFVVYPNPTGNQAEISFNAYMTDDAVLNIMDITGRMVMSRKISPQKGLNIIKLDIEHFTNGIYFVTFTNNYEVQKTKFVKE